MNEKMKGNLLDIVVLVICVACAFRWLYRGLVAFQPVIYVMDVGIGLAWVGAAGVCLVRVLRKK